MTRSASASSSRISDRPEAHAQLDLGRVAADLLAVAAQDLDLVSGGSGIDVGDVPHVGVAGDGPQRLLLAAAADDDREMGLDGWRVVADALGVVVRRRAPSPDPSRSIPRMRSTASSSRFSRSPTLVPKSMPKAVCSVSNQAPPMPSTARPPDR